IPAPVQRIALRGEPGDWWLDGKRIGGGAALSWAPWPGRHQLELKAPGGELIDRVAFEVRGAGVRRR
ncbi:MAG: hypothetical protein HY021_16770, partial [Burkholderiales bacterium]|nr:hypothetical protein [Burkholderiales bacterium]